MRVAAIDVGSNSIKLSVGDVDGGHVRIVESDRITLQLGACVETTGCLGDQAIERAAEAVGQLAVRARIAGARRLDVVGTSAAREATDAQQLQRALTQAAGVPMRILSGLDEAHLVSRSIEATRGLQPGETVLFDIGGGSTEVVRLEGGLVADRCSLPLGAVRLTDRLALRGDAAPTAAQRTAAADQIDEVLAIMWAPVVPDSAFGCGGTVTALARMQHLGMPPTGSVVAVDGVDLAADSVASLCDHLWSASLKARIDSTGLEPVRAEILPAGAAIALHLMRRLEITACRVHEQGIRAGLLADLAAR